MEPKDHNELESPNNAIDSNEESTWKKIMNQRESEELEVSDEVDDLEYGCLSECSDGYTNIVSFESALDETIGENSENSPETECTGLGMSAFSPISLGPSSDHTVSLQTQPVEATDNEPTIESKSSQESPLHSPFSFSSTTEESITDSGPTSREYTAAALTPFTHIWVFGANTSPGVLMSSAYNEIIYAASNLVIINNCSTGVIHRLPGHCNAVSGIACDKNRQWLATIDKGLDSCIIVWNKDSGIPVFTKFSVNSAGYSAVAMSSCGRFVVAADASDAYIFIYEWALPGNHETIISLPDNFDDTVGRLSFTNYPGSLGITVTAKTAIGFILPDEYGFFEIQSPRMRKGFNENCGYFTDTCFLTSSTKAASCTDLGTIVVWEKDPNDQIMKLVMQWSLNPDPISVMRYIKGHIALADTAGVINFYDESFNLKFSSRGINLGSIVAMDFNISWVSHEDQTRKSNIQALTPHDVGICIIGTDDNKIVLVDIAEKKIYNIIENVSGKITCLHSCPTLNLMCTGNSTGEICLYSLRTKQIIKRTQLLTNDKESIFLVAGLCLIKFSPEEEYIVSCQNDGLVRTFEAKTLVPLDCSTEGDKSVEMLVFSKDSSYIGLSDADLTIWLYNLGKGGSLSLIYKMRGIHNDSLVGLFFTWHDPFLKMISVGVDRHMITHTITKDWSEDSLLHNIVKEKDVRIEQFAAPTAILEHPSHDDILIIFTSMFKFKLFDMKKSLFIKTVQGPLLRSGPITTLEHLPDGNCIFFMTGNMVGMQGLPFDGNPFKSISMILSGNPITHYGFAYNGSCLVTMGKDDNCIHFWKMKTEVLNMLEILGGTGLQPYYCLLEQDSTDLMKDIKDYFIYCQIIHEGSTVSFSRQASHSISACELINLFRALGYFPSDFSIRNIYSEIGVNTKSELYNKKIDFESFVKLYLNYKPFFGTAKSILRSFKVICQKHGDPKNHCIPREKFISLLYQKGDAWRPGEMSQIVMKLIGLCSDRTERVASHWTNGPPHNINKPGTAATVLKSSQPNIDFLSPAELVTGTHHISDMATLNEILPEEITLEYFYYSLLGMKRSRMKRGYATSVSSTVKHKSKMSSSSKRVSFV